MARTATGNGSDAATAPSSDDLREQIAVLQADVAKLTRSMTDYGRAQGEHAKAAGVPLIYEPLNRYESNLLNRAEDAVAFLDTLDTDNVVILADLFHMNIEEANIADALRTYGKHIAHVHFVDSNRRPAGCGHMDYTAIASALKEISYDKYASAEAFPWPDSDSAARATIDAFNQYLA